MKTRIGLLIIVIGVFSATGLAQRKCFDDCIAWGRLVKGNCLAAGITPAVLCEIAEIISRDACSNNCTPAEDVLPDDGPRR